MSKCAAAGSAVRFSALYQPQRLNHAPQDHVLKRTGHDGPSRYIGVCCRNGTEIAHHTLSALLDSHPTYIDVSLHVKNAFNSISRDAFMPLVRTHLPDLLPWIDSMYGPHHYHLFSGDLSHPDLPSTVLQSFPKEVQGRDVP